MMSALQFRRVVFQVLHQEWPRTDQAHIASQDVKQLWQFVQAGGAQEAAEASQPLRIRKQLSSLVAGISHRAKLQERKGCSI